MNKKNFVRLANFKDFVGELAVTYTRTSLPQTRIKSSHDVDDFIRPFFDIAMDNHEEFKIIHLNRTNGVVNIEHHTKGTDTASLASVKDIIRNALLIKCHGIIIVHNHPSGTLKPSQQDIALTKKIKTAANYFDIALLDHLVLTRESFFSFADESIL